MAFHSLGEQVTYSLTSLINRELPGPWGSVVQLGSESPPGFISLTKPREEVQAGFSEGERVVLVCLFLGLGKLGVLGKLN